MLISGGLFLIAALAILGVILLASAEVKAQKAKAAGKAAVKPATSISLDKEDTAVPSIETPEDDRAPQKLLLENGEVDTLADQLRQLHQQSQELEKRLATINAMTTRLREAQPVAR